MKNIEIRLEEDKTLGHVEVVIRAAEIDDEVRQLAEKIKSGDTASITVTDQSGAVKVISQSDIIFFSVEGKRINVITKDSIYYLNRPLQSLEKELDPSLFIRTSRFEIVNLKRVVRYDFTLSGTLRIELEGGMETWASRRCIPVIRKRLLGKE